MRTTAIEFPAMLARLSQEIIDCHTRAEEYQRKADTAASDQSRRDFLALQQSWLSLAGSYELAERLLDFSKENQKRREDFFGYDASIPKL
jgi:hypothetical protein